MTGGAAFMRILQICDSMFPVGSFTLSNGLETYVQKGIVTSPDELNDYLGAYISLLPFNELGAAALAYQHPAPAEIKTLDSLFTACKAPSEIRKGSRRVARRFFKAVNSIAAPAGRLREYARLTESGGCFGHQCIAYGLYMLDSGIPLTDGLCVYGYSLCSAIVTNGVKLVPLSQLAGQKVLFAALEHIRAAADAALHTKPEDIGISGGGFDLRAMEHETLYTRLYMS